MLLTARDLHTSLIFSANAVQAVVLLGTSGTSTPEHEWKQYGHLFSVLDLEYMDKLMATFVFYFCSWRRIQLGDKIFNFLFHLSSLRPHSRIRLDTDFSADFAMKFVLYPMTICILCIWMGFLQCQISLHILSATTEKNLPRKQVACYLFPQILHRNAEN